MMEPAKLVEKCRKRGFKITPQRLAIFEALKDNYSHPTAEMLYKEVSRKYPTITLTTVYKTLDMLLKMGEIISLDINPERKHFDPRVETHHHIICEKCKQIMDVFEIGSEIKPPKEIQDKFIVKGYHVDFVGVCKRCSERVK